MTARFFTYLALCCLSLLYLLPLVVMGMTSLKELDEIYTGSLLAWPQIITFESWSKAWNSACVGLNCDGVKPFYRNTFLMVVPSVMMATIIGALMGYILTKWRFYGSQLLFTLLLFGIFMPFQAVIIPLAQTIRAFNITNPILALVLIHTIYGIPFTTLFFRNYFITFPDELIKAAMMDGAGFFRIFWKIVLPSAIPMIVVVVIYLFTDIWNEYLMGVSFAAGDQAPITVALNNIVNVTTGRKQYNLDMAAAIFAAAPTLIVYIIAGKYFLRGLTAGAVKG